jgi:hypothetical protein
MTIASELTLSMLVAIRRHGEDAWVMGIIRRIRRLTTHDAESDCSSLRIRWPAPS